MLKNPSHPGEILLHDVLPYHGLSKGQAAAILNMEPAQLDLILNGRASIDRDIAERIETAWGVSAELLVNMQSNYDVARRRDRRGVPGIVTVGVLALLALAGIAWQALVLWRLLA